MEEEKHDTDKPEFNLKEFIEIIVKAIVDKPDEVKVTEIVSQQVDIYELQVDKSDMGMVIGKRGHHVIALRTLIAATSGKRKKRAQLEIIE